MPELKDLIEWLRGYRFALDRYSNVAYSVEDARGYDSKSAEVMTFIELLSTEPKLAEPGEDGWVYDLEKLHKVKYLSFGDNDELPWKSHDWPAQEETVFEPQAFASPNDALANEMRHHAKELMRLAGEVKK